MEILQERNSSNAFVVRYYPDGYIYSPYHGYDMYAHKIFTTRDHLGSVRSAHGPYGTSTYTYDPYGRTTRTSGAYPGDFDYTGHFRHGPSGLTLAPFRAYDADLGRWLSRDPIEEEGGINLYAYVHNTPINRIDLLGLVDFWVGVEGDFIPVMGVEGSLGLVWDFSNWLDSGINLTLGGGVGWNVGPGVGASLCNNVEGLSWNVDANLGGASPSINLSQPMYGAPAFNGVGVSMGPGAGASGALDWSGTLSIGMAWNALKWIWDLF